MKKVPNKELLMRIAREVCSRRHDKGWTQEELAERADCCRNTISFIEQGRTDLSADLLLRLSKAFDTDIFRLIVKCPDVEGVSAQPNGAGTQVGAHSATSGTEHVTEQVKRLLHCLDNASAGTHDIMQILQLKHRPTFLYDYLQPALGAGLVEMTQPDSPRSPTQKYRLTAKGKLLLKSMRKSS
jgi:transcriptional regulator with XRE-family HTH domain